MLGLFFNDKKQKNLALYSLCSKREKPRIILKAHEVAILNQIVVDQAETYRVI